MSETNDAGPAFPPSPDMKMAHCPAFPGRMYETREWWTGMSLRDWFAGQALVGMVQELTTGEEEHPADWDEFSAGIVAKGAYRFADAMLKARESQP